MNLQKKANRKKNLNSVQHALRNPFVKERNTAKLSSPDALLSRCGDRPGTTVNSEKPKKRRKS
jgi:hypothetical protein